MPSSCSRVSLWSSHQLFLFSLSSFKPHLMLSCHGRSQVHHDLITLHMSESPSQIVVIHGLIAARIRPRGAMCMEKRTPEGLISKLSATSAETRTKSFLNCLNWKATGHMCLWVHTNCCQRQTIEVSLGQNPTVVNEFALKSLREISDLSVWMLQFFGISGRTHLNVGVAG